MPLKERNQTKVIWRSKIVKSIQSCNECYFYGWAKVNHWLNIEITEKNTFFRLKIFMGILRGDNVYEILFW